MGMVLKEVMYIYLNCHKDILRDIRGKEIAVPLCHYKQVLIRFLGNIFHTLYPENHPTAFNFVV
jgi:hypothetical protein